MRETEFRGVILNNDDRDFFGTWWYGDLIHFANGGVGIRQVETGKTLDIIPETVGQFTGLTDKNGKKIFEGDITKSIHKKCMCSGGIIRDSCEVIEPRYKDVMYYNRVDWFSGVKIHGWRVIGKRFQTSLTWSTCLNMKLEVVGNIYDNHELIK